MHKSRAWWSSSSNALNRCPRNLAPWDHKPEVSPQSTGQSCRSERMTRTAGGLKPVSLSSFLTSLFFALGSQSIRDLGGVGRRASGNVPLVWSLQAEFSCRSETGHAGLPAASRGRARGAASTLLPETLHSKAAFRRCEAGLFSFLSFKGGSRVLQGGSTRLDAWLPLNTLSHGCTSHLTALICCCSALFHFVFNF